MRSVLLVFGSWDVVGSGLTSTPNRYSDSIPGSDGRRYCGALFWLVLDDLVNWCQFIVIVLVLLCQPIGTCGARTANLGLLGCSTSQFSSSGPTVT